MADLGSPFEIVKMASEAIKNFANAMASAASDLRKVMSEARATLDDSREDREAKKYRLALRELRGAYAGAPVGFFGELQGFALKITGNRQFPVPDFGGFQRNFTEREAAEFAWGCIREDLNYFADRLDRAVSKLDPAVYISDDIPVDQWIALQIYLRRKASVIRQVSQISLPDDLNRFGNTLLDLCNEMDRWAKSRAQLVNSTLKLEGKPELTRGYDGKNFFIDRYVDKYRELRGHNT